MPYNPGEGKPREGPGGCLQCKHEGHGGWSKGVNPGGPCGEVQKMFWWDWHFRMVVNGFQFVIWAAHWMVREEDQ